MSSKPHPLFILSLIVVLFAGVQIACGLQSSNSKAATVEALASWLAPTATAKALAGDESDDALVTAAAEATAETNRIGATQTALVDLEHNRAATATAFAPILSELPKYGVDATKGEPGWIHPPVTLDLEGYQQNDSTNHYIFTIAEDFAISADLTWNTQYGTSGCGFVLRSDGDEEKPNQYMVLATRGGNGHVVFTIMAEGEFAGTRDFYPSYKDPDFDWQNDSTNRITVVGRGTQFTIYTNDTLIAEFDVTSPPPMLLPPSPEPPENTSDVEAMQKYLGELEKYEQEIAEIREQFTAQMNVSSDKNVIFERGFVAFMAMSESGRTTCDFNNAWLWLIDSDS
ncbi:MAG: hypothetical protein GTO14_11020 [Anaerolineales bacterium]|nr:hypothetical protein [Anaerolineales bacterium]